MDVPNTWPPANDADGRGSGEGPTEHTEDTKDGANHGWHRWARIRKDAGETREKPGGGEIGASVLSAKSAGNLSRE